MHIYKISLIVVITALLCTAPAFALIQVPTEDHQTISTGGTGYLLSVFHKAEDGDTLLVALER